MFDNMIPLLCSGGKYDIYRYPSVRHFQWLGKSLGEIGIWAISSMSLFSIKDDWVRKWDISPAASLWLLNIFLINHYIKSREKKDGHNMIGISFAVTLIGKEEAN